MTGAICGLATKLIVGSNPWGFGIGVGIATCTFLGKRDNNTDLTQRDREIQSLRQGRLNGKVQLINLKLTEQGLSEREITQLQAAKFGFSYTAWR